MLYPLIIFFVLSIGEPIFAVSLSPNFRIYRLMGDAPRSLLSMSSTQGFIELTDSSTQSESEVLTGKYEFSYFTPVIFGHLGVGLSRSDLRLDNTSYRLIEGVSFKTNREVRRVLNSANINANTTLGEKVKLGIKSEIFWAKREIISFGVSSESRFIETSYDFLLTPFSNFSFVYKYNPGSRINELYLTIYRYESHDLEMNYDFDRFSVGLSLERENVSNYDPGSLDRNTYSIMSTFIYNDLLIALSIDHRDAHYRSDVLASLENVQKTSLGIIGELAQSNDGLISISVNRELYSLKSENLNINYSPLSTQISFTYFVR